jgi:site-specific recombinase XerD
LTSEACIKQFVDDYSLKLEESTLNVSKRSIRQLVIFCKKSYNEINTRDIRNWVMHLEEKGYKASSIKRKVIGLRLFYRYCLEEELMNQNPVAGILLPKLEDSTPHYLTKNQMSQLRLICEGDLRQRAIIEVFYSTGVRLRELTNIKLEDVNWTERIIRIPKGKGKKERIVLFTKECAEHLNAYLQNRNDDCPYVFVNRSGNASIYPLTIQQWFKTYRERLGIFLSPHTLRHTFAAHLSIRGMSIACIQALLGHDNPNDTHIYARLNQHAQKQKYDEWM